MSGKERKRKKKNMQEPSLAAVGGRVLGEIEEVGLDEVCLFFLLRGCLLMFVKGEEMMT